MAVVAHAAYADLLIGPACAFAWLPRWVAGAAVTSRRSHDARRENYVASPWSKQTTSLATTGSFRWSRNPMYLGLVTALVGWAAFLSAAWPLLGPAVLVL